MQCEHKRFDSTNAYAVTVGNVLIGFSYDTPVVLQCFSRSGFDCYVPGNTYSRTTTRHIRKYFNTRNCEPVTPDEFLQRLQEVLALEALSVVKRRMEGQTQ